jgi:hypothetical protein
MGAVRPDTLLLRRARFEEVGAAVMVTVAFPELLRARDREAMASLDSGFETTLVYDLMLHEHGTNRVLEQHRRVVKVRYDYLNRRYEVTTRDDGGTRARRFFKRRSDAAAAAVELRRMRVGRTEGLGRGEAGPFYYVTVLGQRNPLTPTQGEPGLDPGTGRAQGRDTRWFRRFVNFLAGELPEAEETVRFRTQPFYLRSR